MGDTRWYTTTDIAAIYGVGIARVHQLAESRGVKPKMFAGRARWSTAQMHALKPGKVGRPKKAKA